MVAVPKDDSPGPGRGWPRARAGDAAMMIALLGAAAMSPGNVPYGTKLRRGRTERTPPPQKAKVVKVTCRNCGNHFKSRLLQNTCRKCNHYGTVSMDTGKF